jgi:hypothetical protein
MSILSQLAAEIAAAAATAAAPLTQAPDDVSSESVSRSSAVIPAAARRSVRLSSLPAVTAAASSADHDSGGDSRDAGSCSPCLSSTPPPFVAPDMLDPLPPVRLGLAVMPWREQQHTESSSCALQDCMPAGACVAFSPYTRIVRGTSSTRISWPAASQDLSSYSPTQAYAER